MSPSEVHAPDRAGGNTPQAVEATGGNEPCRHRRTSQALSLDLRAHEQGKVRGRGRRARVGATITGTIVSGATPGTVQLQARKGANTDATTPADDLTVHAGSTIIYRRIS